MEFGKRTRRIMKNYMVWAKKNDKDIEGFGEEDRKNLMTLICFYIEFKSMKKKEWEKVSKKDKVYIQSLQVFDQYIHQKKLNKFIEEYDNGGKETDKEKDKKKEPEKLKYGDDYIYSYHWNPFRAIDAVLMGFCPSYHRWRNT